MPNDPNTPPAPGQDPVNPANPAPPVPPPADPPPVPPAPPANPATPPAEPPADPDGALDPDKARKLINRANADAAKWRTKYRELEATTAANGTGQDWRLKYADAHARAEALQAQLAALEAEVTNLRPLQEQVTAAQVAQRTEALEALPEDLRTSLADAPLDTIRAVAARILAPGRSPDGPRTPPTDPGRNGQGGNNPPANNEPVPFGGGLGNVLTMLNQNKG